MLKEISLAQFAPEPESEPESAPEPDAGGTAGC
jgi:hypothetical protein